MYCKVLYGSGKKFVCPVESIVVFRHRIVMGGQEPNFDQTRKRTCIRNGRRGWCFCKEFFCVSGFVLIFSLLPLCFGLLPCCLSSIVSSFPCVLTVVIARQWCLFSVFPAVWHGFLARFSVSLLLISPIALRLCLAGSALYSVGLCLSFVHSRMLSRSVWTLFIVCL